MAVANVAMQSRDSARSGQCGPAAAAAAARCAGFHRRFAACDLAEHRSYVTSTAG